MKEDETLRDEYQQQRPTDAILIHGVPMVLKPITQALRMCHVSIAKHLVSKRLKKDLSLSLTLEGFVAIVTNMSWKLIRHGPRLFRNTSLELHQKLSIFANTFEGLTVEWPLVLFKSETHQCAIPVHHA